MSYREQIETSLIPLDIPLSFREGLKQIGSQADQEILTLHATIEELKHELQIAENDNRPANCRFRLQDKGKPYPRSACQACGKSIVTGLGTMCTLTKGNNPTADALDELGGILCDREYGTIPKDDHGNDMELWLQLKERAKELRND